MSSLFQSGNSRGAILISAPVDDVEAGLRSSLFSGTTGKSFFAPYPVRPDTRAGRSVTRPVAALLDVIAGAEAGSAGYDAVQHGARIKTPDRPTRMTLAEIDAWTRATPGQQHAIGRYQFIPATLRRLVADAGMSERTVFTAQVQDHLALMLLEEAGLHQFKSGALGQRRFMRNLAQIWAGLPLPNGRSYYHGHAGNRATMSWARFENGVTQAFSG